MSPSLDKKASIVYPFLEKDMTIEHVFAIYFKISRRVNVSET